MSILDSVENAFKGGTRPVNSGDGDKKSPIPSIGGLIGVTKYLKEGENNPLHETAKKNINVAELLGFPSSAHPKNPIYQSGIKPAAINQDIKELIKEPRVRAMLDTIAYAEGTGKDPDRGYGRVVKGTVVHAPHHPEILGQRNVTTADFSKHPDISVRFRNGEYSTAAGRYQFKHQTWSDLHLPDFSPESQDIGAVMLLQGRGSLDPLLHDDFEKAIRNSNKEWASFPGSPYGQPTKSMAQL